MGRYLEFLCVLAGREFLHAVAPAGQHEQAMQVMERVLQQKGDTHFDFLALAAADTDERTRAGLLDGFQRLLERYPDNQQLLFGQALLLYQDGRYHAAPR